MLYFIFLFYNLATYNKIERENMELAYKKQSCTKLNESHIGTETVLAGWASTIRDLGGIIFVELKWNRDVDCSKILRVTKLSQKDFTSVEEGIRRELEKLS